MKALVFSFIVLSGANVFAKDIVPACQVATFVKYCKVQESIYIDRTVSPETRVSSFSAQIKIISSLGKVHVDTLATVDTFAQAQAIIDSAAVCRQ